jgi:hypothetical protein
MIDIDGTIKRDQILQYLAFYTATKGLMITTDSDAIHKRFVEFKQMICKRECTLEWLANSVLTKWGVPEEPNTQLPPNMIIVPADVFDKLARFYVDNMSEGDREKDGVPGSDGTLTGTLPPPGSFTIQDVLKHVEQSLNGIRDAIEDPPPTQKPKRTRKTRKTNENHLP